VAIATTDVTFRCNSAEIHGTLRHASGAGRRPLAILVHGFGSFRDELTGFVELADRLSASGIASLRFDARGCGQSGTRGHTHPAWDWIEDIAAAASFAETLPGIAADRMGIVGMSMGGGTAVIAAALDSRLKAIVALAPVTDGEAWFRHLWTNSKGAEGWASFQAQIAEDRRCRALTGGAQMVDVLDAMAYADADRHAFLEIAKTYPAFLHQISLSSIDSAMRIRAVPMASLIAPRPLLIIHSRADGSVPVEQAQALAAASGEPSRLLLLDHSPHCFWIGEDSARVQDETQAWLERHL